MSKVSTLSTEIAVSGSVNGSRVRGRLLAGLASPDSLYMEAPAPFGAPVFVLGASRGDATLLLPRDRRVLEHGRPDEVLGAITGVPLSPSDLRATLTGCVAGENASEGDASAVGNDWRMIAGEPVRYLRRERADGSWRLVSVVRRGTDGWRADYSNFSNDLPRTHQADRDPVAQVRFPPRTLASRHQRRTRALHVPRHRSVRHAADLARGTSRRRPALAMSPIITRPVRVRACAKINLTLRVLGIRPDGYHELRTTFQSVALHDTLTFTTAPGPFAITSDHPRCPIDATNLVAIAAHDLWRAAGRTGVPRGLGFISPSESRLKPGSAAAAATRPRHFAH